MLRKQIEYLYIWWHTVITDIPYIHNIIRNIFCDLKQDHTMK